MADKYPGTKLALVCGSFLAFAGLTAFVGTQDQEASIQTGATTPAVVADRAVDSQGGAISTLVEEETSTPVATTRGT